MGRVNLTRALCACVLALALHAVTPTAPSAEDTGGFTVVEAEAPSGSTPTNAKWNAALAQWEANMLTFGRTHCQTLVKKVDQYGNVQTDNLLVQMTYYDAIEVYLQIYQYTKDASWLDCAKAAKYAYRDLQVMAQPIPGRVPGYWNFTNGLVLDYEINGDVVSKNAAIFLSQNAAYAGDGTPLPWTNGPARSREAAYAIRSYVNAGETRGPPPGAVGRPCQPAVRDYRSVVHLEDVAHA